jgi:hypothetical protein
VPVPTQWPLLQSAVDAQRSPIAPGLHVPVLYSLALMQWLPLAQSLTDAHGAPAPPSEHWPTNEPTESTHCPVRQSLA